MVPTGVQLIPAGIIMALVPFTPESPRWLVLKSKKSKAKANSDKIRPRLEVESGATEIEINTIEALVEESFMKEQGRWLDLFKGNYLRRTWVSRIWIIVLLIWGVLTKKQICATLFILEQTNGNQFVQSYAPTFYVQ